MDKEFTRPVISVIGRRLCEPRRFVQVLAGPRQVGKTTLARQVMAELPFESLYVSADEPTLQDRAWLAQQWETARLKATSGAQPRDTLFIVDEIQKVAGWSETVKRLWDEDTLRGLPLRVMLLGSSPLLVQQGLTESLAGRFEIIPVTHWSFSEMREAFGWGVDEYVYFGGYPGSAALISDHDRWARYVADSLIETTISRDILLMTRVDKPALLRRLFHLGCEYSGQVLSLQKMLGHLQDAGNVTTLSHYLDLLNGAGLLGGLQKYAGQRVRQRASSPKLQVWNTALMTALLSRSLDQARQDPALWGRLVESAVGSHLLNDARGKPIEVYYWRERNQEVDFVLRRGDELVSVEVKSGLRRRTISGIDAFSKSFDVKRQLLVGGQGLSLAEFLAVPVDRWMQ
jgi:uncharacterized protein